MLFGRTRSCEARVRYWALWTSYEALVGCAKLQTGEWVLVLAAAGGVGIAAIQIAKAIGARVIAAASLSLRLLAWRAVQTL